MQREEKKTPEDNSISLIPSEFMLMVKGDSMNPRTSRYLTTSH